MFAYVGVELHGVRDDIKHPLLPAAVIVDSVKPLKLEVTNRSATPMHFSEDFTCPGDPTPHHFSIDSEPGETAEAFGRRARLAFEAFKTAYCAPPR